ncbi:hypothetical protein JB92DRAFT_3117127 [Gautieria morchelliformis]|nr:hypothetical protein JB92DRAFT_3117127 [Gautieria morchelliformis]
MSHLRMYGGMYLKALAAVHRNVSKSFSDASWNVRIHLRDGYQRSQNYKPSIHTPLPFLHLSSSSKMLPASDLRPHRPSVNDKLDISSRYLPPPRGYEAFCHHPHFHLYETTRTSQEMPHVAPNSPSELHARAEEADHGPHFENRVYYPEHYQAGVVPFAAEADHRRLQNRVYYPEHWQAAFDRMDPAAVAECERRGPNALHDATNIVTDKLPCTWPDAIKAAILGSPFNMLTCRDIFTVIQARFPLCTNVKIKLGDSGSLVY